VPCFPDFTENSIVSEGWFGVHFIESLFVAGTKVCTIAKSIGFNTTTSKVPTPREAPPG
jgi:hypothetical protein